MGKYTNTHFANISLIFLLVSCSLGTSTLRKNAKEQSDAIINAIANGSASKFFKPKYFSTQGDTILVLLKNHCDFANRKGNFINDFVVYNNGNIDNVTEIYEFHLKCGDVRILMTFQNENKETVLIGFHIESARADNSMIIYPDRRIIKK